MNENIKRYSLGQVKNGRKINKGRWWYTSVAATPWEPQGGCFLKPGVRASLDNTGDAIF